MPSHHNVMRWLLALSLATGVALINLAAWRLFNPPLSAPDVPFRVAGLAYNAFQRWDSPLTQHFPATSAVAADLALLARQTDRLRTYSAAELPELPLLAQQHGLRLALGVWLDRRKDNNEREISAALSAVRETRSVERIIAGNETQLHAKLSPAELYAYLDRLRITSTVPVSTAEPWHIWLEQPDLAGHVDFITVHLLPYWEGVPVAVALDEALRRYAELHARFPGKPLVIGEIGWPGGGADFKMAAASPAAQAQFVRNFLARAAPLNLDYYLMEAVDQPWKRATEGTVGAYWGLMDAARQPKFSFSGPVYDDPHWSARAMGASALGALLVLPFLLTFAHMRLAGRITFALLAQTVAACAVWLASLPLAHYLRVQEIVAWALLAPALALTLAIMLAQGLEFAELFWSGSLRRRTLPHPLKAAESMPPFVSIHLACCNEPPEMVIAAIDSLLALDWPAFEIIVIDNNTTDPALWRPVRRHVVRRLRERRANGQPGQALRFFHLPHWPGFKAGALNFALAHTNSRADWVAVVDADYLVKPAWLRAVAGYFDDTRVGIVQCPQAHRDWQHKLSQRMMNWEYDGFFRIGMHHRHERDAIIQHGTMTLIRAVALRTAGGWDEQCIVEDTELGLRLFQHGWQAIYVDHELGAGLVPADFKAYRRQRRRWAQGAMQILLRHTGALVSSSSLSLGQRYHFIAGWLPWLGDALHLLFSLAAILWTLAFLVAPDHFGLPLAPFIIPLTVFFLVRLVLGPLLYWRCVPCPSADIAGAALAGMGLSHSIARGIIAGLAGGHAIFHVTRRSGSQSPRPSPTSTPDVAHPASALAEVREELSLLLGLWVCIAALLLLRPSHDVLELAWAMLLGIQSLPYLAALFCAWQSWRDSAPSLCHS